MQKVVELRRPKLSDYVRRLEDSQGCVLKIDGKSASAVDFIKFAFDLERYAKNLEKLLKEFVKGVTWVYE